MHAEFKEDDASDDNRSSSLGRSAQSDNASLASDNQDDGALECELTIRTVLPLCVCAAVRARLSGYFFGVQRFDCQKPFALMKTRV